MQTIPSLVKTINHLHPATAQGSRITETQIIRMSSGELRAVDIWRDVSSPSMKIRKIGEPRIPTTSEAKSI